MSEFPSAAMPERTDHQQGSPEGALPRPTKLFYACGSFAENLAINSVYQLSYAIFNIVLGVSPALIGLALAAPRALDIVLDPVIGSVSDRWRSRWGRRRPFILVGGLLAAACACGMWFFPQGHSTDFYFWWLLLGSFALATGYSVLIVPYGALGFELTANHHERTSLMGYRSAANKISGVANQWLVAIVQIGIFGGLLAGARYVGVFLGTTIAVLAACTAAFVHERQDLRARATRTMGLAKGLRETLRQRDFLSLVIAQIFIYSSVLVVDSIGFYLNVFYVNGGDLKYGGILKGIAGTAFQVGGLLAIPLIVRLSRRIGKKAAFSWCTASVMLAGIAKWFCYYPGAGWWIALPSLLLAPGLVAVLVMVPSMTADVCDLDEVNTRQRREGMYNSVVSWTVKLCLSATVGVAGLLLALSGWHTNLGAAQSPHTYLVLRILFSGVTIACAIAAVLAIRFYRIDERKVREVQDELQRRLESPA